MKSITRMQVVFAATLVLVAVLALPAMAHAATFASEFPGPGSSMYVDPGFVSVDVLSSVAIKSATVNGDAVPVIPGSSSGVWSYSELEAPAGSGYYVGHWAFTAGGSGNIATIIAPVTSVLGVNDVEVVVTDNDGAGSTDSWSYTLLANGTPPPPPTPTTANQTCRSSNCHGTTFDDDNAMGPVCTDCHIGGFAPHGFDMMASGHSTTLLGYRGPRTRFDGSQGVTLTWTATQSFTVSSAKLAALTTTSAVYATPGQSFTAGETGIVQTQWDFPTTAVFWPAGDPDAPASAMTGLSATSVVACEDCHTGLAAAGPQGAAAANFGLDPAYPADYAAAGLTKKVTPGGTLPSGGYSVSGIFVTNDADIIEGMETNTTYVDGTDEVICAKCHKLMAVVPAGTGPGTSGLAWETVEGANTAHDSHHQDNATAQCVGCHIAIPHGWKAPRLLVDGPKYAGTPYFSSEAVEVGMGTIAALNNHPLVGADGVIPYSTSNGGAGSVNFAHAGTVPWDESQCDACGDHYGNDFYRGTYGNSTAVPVRIDF